MNLIKDSGPLSSIGVLSSSIKSDFGILEIKPLKNVPNKMQKMLFFVQMIFLAFFPHK